MFNQSYFPLGQFPGCRVGFKESTRHSAKRNSKRYEQVSIEGNRSDPKSGSRKEQKRTASGRRSVLSAAREAKQSSVQTQKAINYPLPLFCAFPFSAPIRSLRNKRLARPRKPKHLMGFILESDMKNIHASSNNRNQFLSVDHFRRAALVVLIDAGGD
jgi:hypothetical protein